MFAKQEFQPLLPIGFHDKSLQEIQAICVTPFKERGSSTRQPIMDGLEIVVKRLTSAGIVGELWVDGSFTTEKIDPLDVDILLLVDEEFYDKASPEQLEVMKWLQANLKSSHLCDSRYWITFNTTDPAYSEWWRAYWIKMFGFYRDEGPNSHEPKGIIRLLLPACIQ